MISINSTLQYRPKLSLANLYKWNKYALNLNYANKQYKLLLLVNNLVLKNVR